MLEPSIVRELLVMFATIPYVALATHDFLQTCEPINDPHMLSNVPARYVWVIRFGGLEASS